MTGTENLAVQSLPISVEHITTEDGFDALKDDWQRLATQSSNTSVFNGWHWNRLWWQHYGYLGELLVIVVRVENTVQAIAPFYLCTTRAFRIWPVKTLRFIGKGGDTAPDDLNLLCAASYQSVTVPALKQSMLQSIPGLARISLTDIPEQSPLLGAFAKTDATQTNAEPILGKTCRRVQMLPGTLDEYRSDLSRNARKHWKRRSKALYSAGDIRFIQCKTTQQVNDTFDELVSLHHARHATKGHTDSFGTDRYLKFHRTLMQTLLKSGELWLFKLQLDQRTIGVEYTFMVNNRLSFFQAGFDPDFHHLSPGHQLMMHMIEEAIAQGVTSIDLLKGDYEYKTSYAKQWRCTASIDWWQHPLIEKLYRWLKKLRR